MPHSKLDMQLMSLLAVLANDYKENAIYAEDEHQYQHQKGKENAMMHLAALIDTYSIDGLLKKHGIKK